MDAEMLCGTLVVAPPLVVAEGAGAPHAKRLVAGAGANADGTLDVATVGAGRAFPEQIASLCRR